MPPKRKSEANANASKPGPKLMGSEKRVRTTLCFDRGVLKKAKRHASKIDKSLSLWIEELMKVHIGKS